MHSGFKSLLLGDAEEQSGEESALVFAERCAERSLVLSGDLANEGQCLFSFLGEVQGIDAPVALGGLASKKAFALEFVDEGYEAAGVHAKALGELLLAEPGGLGDETKDSGVGGRELVRGQPLREALRGVRTYLSQQEGG